MTSVSYPPSRPGSTKSPFGGSSSGGFGGHSDEVYNGLGLDGAGGGGKRSKRILKTQPLEMTTLSTKRKGTNPFDGASSDDNRRRKNTKSNGQGDWKKKGAQTSVARSNGAKRGAKGFGTSQSRRGFGSQNTDNHQGTESPEYETDDANGDAAGDGTPYSDKILAQLRKEGIAPPKWPSDPGNTKQKAAMAKFREDYKTYRDRARTSLMRAGLIDDPDKPKRLEDAIDFKGICDGMCPDFEKITRITEFDVQSAEKDSRTFAITSKMVKKLARSAAGQEAPLPMDVRSTAALRKTLDYLIDELLQTDENLPTMHGFLWDRTRAIRRDFIFHSTMAPEEMKDQVYCLETIARFHVISLHLLSQEGLTPEDFSEQQEIEQLGKSLLSLMFAYDDCKPHGVICENEAEFRAYHLLFSANKPNILDDVQKEWGDSRFWTESDEIRTAVSLVESLQNTDDFHGPLGSAPSMAISGAHRTYFKIVESRQVSYTMACFAEIHLGQLRRSALRSLKKAYTRPRNTAKDITPSILNRFLHFDTEAQAVEFAEKHGLSFVDTESPSGELIQYLDTSNRITWPRIHHSFSQKLVERKRGTRSLPEIIHSTIHDESSNVEPAAFASSNGGLFPNDASSKTSQTQSQFGADSLSNNNNNAPFQSPFGAAQAATPTNPSGTPIFGKASDGTPTTAASSSPFGNPFSAQKPSFGTEASFAANQAPPSSTGASTNPFSAKPSPFSQPEPTPGKSPFGGSPFAPPIQPNGTTKPPGSSASPFAPAGSGPSAQQKTQEADQSTQPKPTATSTSAASPAISVTPPTPQFALPGPGSVSKPPSPSAAGPTASTPPSAPSASPFSGLSSASPAKPAVTASPVAQNSSAATLSNAEQPKSTPAQTPFNGLATAPTQPPVKPPSSGLPSTQSPLPSFNFQANNVPPTNPAPSTQPFPAPATTTTPATGLGFTPAPPPKPPVAERRPPQDVMGDFAKWFVTGDNGLIHEFEKYIVEQIVSDAFEQYHREEEERKRKEEEEKALAEARAFQVHNLSLKYFYRWRTIARNLRLSKIRRQQREEFRIAQAEMREEEIKRKKKAARVAEARRRALEEHGVDPVEELREILQLKKGDEPQEDLQAEAEALFATGILSGVTNERAAIANVIQAPSFATPPPPSRSTNSLSQSVSAKPCGAKTRALREEFSSSSRSFRRSLPPMSAHSSSSRFTPSESPQKRVSKVSDRWRLKAMGLVTMPDGSALPESIANEMLYNGKRYSGLGSFGLDGTERRSRSVSADLNHAAEARQRFSQSLNGTTSTQAANGISPLSKRKRSRDDDKEATTADEAARVKKRPSSNADVERILREARENLESLRSSRVDLDEGAEWFREQNEMMQAEEMSRASSPWGKGRN